MTRAAAWLLAPIALVACSKTPPEAGRADATTASPPPTATPSASASPPSAHDTTAPAPSASADDAGALPNELADAIASGGADLAVTCAAFMGHGINAAPRPDRGPLERAMSAWRAALRHAMAQNEADQYFASTFAVLRDTPPDRLAAATAWCTAHAPRRP
jgi:hypothetical protein